MTMTLNTQFLQKCIQSLELAFGKLKEMTDDDILYNVYRAATIKEFEIILEQSGKMLRKCLHPYFHSPKEVTRMTFKEAFRSAGQHDLLTIDEVQRWLEYRDNRNFTAHDYGADFADKTLPLIPQFIKDAKKLSTVIEQKNDSQISG